MNPVKSIVLIISCFFSSLYAQSEGQFEKGKLFAQIKKENVASFSAIEFSGRQAYLKFKISKISKAFKIDEEPLNRIYLVEFDGSVPADFLLAELQSTGLFEYVEKVPVYKSFYTPNDLNSTQWNLKKILAEKAWDVKKGSSKITIAIVDDAMDTAHPDLEPVVWRNKGEIRGNGIDDDANGYVDDYIGWDAADNDNDPTPGGSLQHGTHCSGIAGAATNNSKGIASIAFGCRLMIAKIGQVGSSYLVNAYQGVEYAIINKANVISMSWGGGGYSYTYQLIFDNAYKKGIVCVAAAGNSSTSIIHYPSGYNHVIAVGSTTSSDQVSSFSNYGTWVDVMAPGSNIYSTLPNSKYGYLSGTSMACPLVSGLCGLMFSQRPDATPDEIEACLKSGCDNINSLNSSYIGSMGAGRINAENSLKCLKPINAAFISNVIQTCPGDTIKFFDKSQPTPLAIKWKFPGGNPSASFLTNPKIIYNIAGVYDVELIVFDSTQSDTLLMKNYITIAKPTALISVNRTIITGSTTSVRLDFTGNPPYNFTLFDGTNSQVISNINTTPYFHLVSPIVTTTYSLTAYKEKKCAGTYSGISVVTVVKTGSTCNSALKYQASFGGLSDDIAYGMTEDEDNNIYISGSTLNYNNGDGFFAKFNSAGNMVWYKTYGGSSGDYFQKHIRTPDKGFLLVGSAASYGVGNGDVWVVKVDSSGTVQWSKTVGGANVESAWYATVANDNGYFVYGNTSSYGAGGADNYLVRLDKNGNLKWAKAYGNAYFNDLKGLATYPDGSSIFCSNYATSTSGDALLSKIDSLGNLAWSVSFGGSFNDGLYTMVKGNDNNIYIAGFIRSSGTNQEMFIASFTPSGTKRWMKLITGSGDDALYNIEKDGYDIMVNGHTNSYGYGGIDGSFIKLDSSGNIIFAKVMGGSSDDYVFSCLKSIDDGYYSVGYTKSFSNGANDIFLNKFSCKPSTGCNEKDYSPSISSVSLTLVNESQSTISGGTLNTQSISATTRSIGVTYQCKTPPNYEPTYNCLKVDNYSKISSTTTGFSGVLDDGDYFGQTVRNFGDFDGDGVEDLIVGAQLDDDGGNNQGAVYIICLKRDGSVKSRQKISATSGGFSGSLSGAVYFGSGVSKLKDVDGDGVNDLLVGHIYDNTGNTRAGAVWIIFLKANGTVKSYQKIANGTGGFPFILDADDNFGSDANELGDMNGDGITDIMVGAPYDDDGGLDKGAVYIIYLKSDGTVKSYKKISSTSGGFSGTLGSNDQFGHGVGGSADLNYDGYMDVVVGARSSDDGGTDRGSAWILFLDAGQTVIGQKKISSTSGSFSGPLKNGDYFGAGLEIVGDINKDGYLDLAVSAPYDDDGGVDRGAAWLLYLDNTGSVKSQVKISAASQQLLKNKIDNSDLLGWRVSYLNDIDGNGQKEIVIGAMLDDDGGTDRGAVYILNLGDTCRYSCLKTSLQSKISATQGTFSGSLANGDGFGSGVNGIGDIDNDGIRDMAVCASGDDDGGNNVGALWILFMKKDGTVRAQQKISASQGGFGGLITNGNYFGNRIVPLGDLNSDGVQDIAVSHHFDNSYNTRAGSIYILFLNSNGTVKSHQKITTGVGGFTPILSSDDRFGLGLENIGDFDGDGVVDLLAGAQEDKDGGSAKGAFYILYLKTDGTIKSYSKISTTQGNFSGSLNPGDRFGFSLTSPGDINKDGIIDFVIGSRDDGDGGNYRGAIWTLFMNANGTVKSYQKNSSTIGNLTGVRDGDEFSQDMRAIDDLDNDGINELAISSPNDDDGGTDRGALWIVYLNNSGKIKKQIKVSSTTSALTGKIDNSDLFGWGVGVLNDLNGDGYKEIAIGSLYDDDGGTDKGGVYIINLKDTCTVTKPKCRIRASFSYSLGCVGDTIKFIDASIDSAKVGFIKWKWSYGDGGKYEGSPTTKHVYNSPGTYLVKLVVYSNGNSLCADSVTRPVKISNQLRLLGLSDITICRGDSGKLGVGGILCGNAPYTYLWQPSAGLSSSNIINPKASPAGTTKYILTITDKNNQQAMDTILVKVDSNCCVSHAAFITNGDTKCENDTFILTNQSKPNLGANFNWKITAGGNYISYPGKSPPPLIFNKTGVYNIRLILNDICGTDTVSKDVYVYPSPKADAGRDSTFCRGDSAMIGSVGIGRNQYFWTPSTGLDHDNIAQPIAHITKSISYILKMITEEGCTATDIVNFTVSRKPFAYLGKDTFLCNSDTIPVNATDSFATSYLWNDGSVDPIRQLSKPGKYTCTVSNKCGTFSSSITIGMINSAIPFLDTRVIICTGDTAILNATNSNASYYLWNDGSIKPIKLVDQPGTYRIKMGNICGEYDTSVIVESKVCECDIFIPNTFTPVNSPGINDLFRPVIPTGCEPNYYRLNIYNRWGELIFTTNDYNEGWNGEYKGKKVINGNYNWIITLQYPYTNKGKTFKKTGNLLIIE